MGTDVHAVFQKETDDGWVDVESAFDEPRDYFLFAWIAGVRNGFGFAGCPIFKPIESIQKERGLPTDFVVNKNYEYKTAIDNEYNRDGMKWMGYHDHGWLLWEEIVNAKLPVQWVTGYTNIDHFNKWSGTGFPGSLCGDVAGGNTVKAENPSEITDETTHVRVSYIDNESLISFVEEVQNMIDEYGNGRIVFGFDS